MASIRKTFSFRNGVQVDEDNFIVNAHGLVGIGDDLHVGGDITAFASSDQTLKENTVGITSALYKVGLITGYTYSWKSGTEHSNYHQNVEDTGVIAQEVEALGLPGITTTRDNGIKAVRYERLVPLLIQAIKELEARVKTLESS